MMGSLNRSLQVAALLTALGTHAAPSMTGGDINPVPAGSYYAGRSRSRQPTCKKTRADIRVPNRKKNKAARQSRKANR